MSSNTTAPLRCLVLLACVSASSQTLATDLITGPESAVYVVSTTGNGATFSHLLGDASVLAPTWNIAQWANPEPIGADLKVPAGTSWQFSNATTKIAFYHAPNAANQILQHTYELTQNGAAPSFPLACGSEFDLFLQANTGSEITQSGAASPSRFAQSGKIGRLSALALSFGLNIVGEEVANDSCSPTYAGYLISVILNSTTGDALFYQIVLRDSRQLAFNNQLCPGFGTGNVYCYGESIYNVINQPYQRPGSGRTAYSFDFLNPLKAAIRALPAGGDNNPADWYVTGLYLGQIIQGGMMPTSRWDSISLTAY